MYGYKYMYMQTHTRTHVHITHYIDKNIYPLAEREDSGDYASAAGVHGLITCLGSVACISVPNALIATCLFIYAL